MCYDRVLAKWLYGKPAISSYVTKFPSSSEVAQPVEAVAQVELGSCGVVDHGGSKAVRFTDFADRDDIAMIMRSLQLAPALVQKLWKEASWREG